MDISLIIICFCLYAMNAVAFLLVSMPSDRAHPPLFFIILGTLLAPLALPLLAIVAFCVSETPALPKRKTFTRSTNNRADFFTGTNSPQ